MATTGKAGIIYFGWRLNHIIISIVVLLFVSKEDYVNYYYEEIHRFFEQVFSSLRMYNLYSVYFIMPPLNGAQTARPQM